MPDTVGPQKSHVVYIYIHVYKRFQKTIWVDSILFGAIKSSADSLSRYYIYRTTLLEEIRDITIHSNI